MGETTDMVLKGLLCQSCGSLVDGTMVGYPRDCEDCEDED